MFRRWLRKRAIDPAVLVTQHEVTALLGAAELTFEATGDECLWVACAPDHSWSLRLRVKDTALLRKPYIFVTKGSFYYDGQADPDNPIVEHIKLGQAPRTKIVEMKQLAHAVEARLTHR